ncbi:class I SAM-dependent methyltransferase [soil metagenome]
MRLPPVLSFAHELVGRALAEGDVAVDATVGNGHDTLLLARLVGPSGLVFGLDIQAAALASTRIRLFEAGLDDRVRLFLASHDEMSDRLGPEVVGRRVGVVMFNLGYLPGSGGDRSRITRPETTLPALEVALGLLAPGGLLTVVLYPGHPGGRIESEAVSVWAETRAPSRANVLRYEFLNPEAPSPILLAMVSREPRHRLAPG